MADGVGGGNGGVWSVPEFPRRRRLAPYRTESVAGLLWLDKLVLQAFNTSALLAKISCFITLLSSPPPSIKDRTKYKSGIGFAMQLGLALTLTHHDAFK